MITHCDHSNTWDCPQCLLLDATRKMSENVELAGYIAAAGVMAILVVVAAGFWLVHLGAI